LNSLFLFCFKTKQEKKELTKTPQKNKSLVFPMMILIIQQQYRFSSGKTD